MSSCLSLLYLYDNTVEWKCRKEIPRRSLMAKRKYVNMNYIRSLLFLDVCTEIVTVEQSAFSLFAFMCVYLYVSPCLYFTTCVFFSFFFSGVWFIVMFSLLHVRLLRAVIKINQSINQWDILNTELPWTVTSAGTGFNTATAGARTVSPFRPVSPLSVHWLRLPVRRHTRALVAPLKTSQCHFCTCILVTLEQLIHQLTLCI